MNLALWRQGRAPDGTPALVERDDEDLASAPHAADAAGLAAVACACGAGLPRCDAARLLAFWEWWLGEAVPQAVEASFSQDLGRVGGR
ncbi:hypothetical protein F8S13_23920 [Chloroflexia bacterium SDU3-3]|nr:hypothetical protein F8S13_23920 [Chloroflexia bacterium SDU3-3]